MGSGGSQLNQCEECGTARSDLVDGLCPVCIDANMATISPNATPNHGADQTIAPGASQSETHEDSKQVGDYDLIEEIARGGMGVVYKANHRNLNRVSAVKMILGGRFSSEEELQRFRIEAESAAKLDHPSIVPIFEIGESEGQAFFAMKYIDGGSLADKADGLVDDPRTSADIMLKVAEAVHHAHQRAVLHRDLKPANILLDQEGHPYVTDLGLAKSTSGGSDLTHTGAVLGTPSYMPPEQAAGQSVTTAADVYSLGAILYQLLVGRRPFEGDTSVNVVMQVIDGPPPLPHKVMPTVDQDLELICMKAMERDPKNRYSSAQQMADDLKAWLNGDSISVKPPSLGAVISNWFKRYQQLSYAMFAIFFGVLLCAPVALAFLSDDMADVYERFPDTEVPLLYSIRFPGWLSALSSILLILVIWPSIGFCNAAITRPKSASHALYSGWVWQPYCH
jgi:serine/threonine protein kinase